MRLVLIGKTGQVAREIQNLVSDSISLIALSRKELDLLNPDSSVTCLSKLKPDVIINAAAYTNVDLAEKEEDEANTINALSPTAIANYSASKGIPLIHLSTDYVFEGTGKDSWKPKDSLNPRSAYGRSKLKGELGILASKGNHIILRTSWIFSSYGNNFLKKIIELSKSNNEINVVSDQVGGPTPACEIAKACLNISQKIYLDPNKKGIYHFSGKPNVSWAGFAKEIIHQLGSNVVINDISTNDFKNIARRPYNSRLDCSSLNKKFGIERPEWKSSLLSMLKQLKEV